jgi:hypothetical protein
MNKLYTSIQVFSPRLSPEYLFHVTRKIDAPGLNHLHHLQALLRETGKAEPSPFHSKQPQKPPLKQNQLQILHPPNTGRIPDPTRHREQATTPHHQPNNLPVEHTTQSTAPLGAPSPATAHNQQKSTKFYKKRVFS